MVAQSGSAGDYADRALRAYAAMQRAFARPDGGYRRDGVHGRRGALAHLWPLARAFVATLDLAGIAEPLRGGFDAHAEVARHLAVVERYWAQPPGRLPAYASDPPGSRFGGDRYHDDNAWVALALIQLERLRRGGLDLPAAPGSGTLTRVEQLWRFAVSGWDHSPASAPGGVFWVEQGVGIGKRNHDRNAVTCAPNAEVGLHLAELGVPLVADEVAPEALLGWVARQLDAGGDGNGLFRDKIRGDGTIDPRLWSYNQGSMLGGAALLARRAAAAGDGRDANAWLDRAHAIARRAERAYAGAAGRGDPPEFMAIMFRNMLVLEAVMVTLEAVKVTPEAVMGAARRRPPLETVALMRSYAEVAWSRYRDTRDRFHFPGRGHTLLGQSAIVQILALLAWDSDRYEQLA